MSRFAALAAAFGLLLCGCGESASSVRASELVLRTADLPKGYQYGDDSACGIAGATEGDWPKLEPLFAAERPDSCAMELEWVWAGRAPYSNGLWSAAYLFDSEDAAHRAFEARDELASFTGTLDAKEREPFQLGDEAELLRGRGLNNAASGVVWRDGDIVGVIVVEPAKDDAARELAREQQRRIEHPSPSPPQENDTELQLDDPTVKLPVYWLGRSFDPPGPLPRLELELANVGGNGPGQVIQLWYRSGVTLDTYEPETWASFRRTRLGRLIWDSPCARKEVVPVKGGRAEIFMGYGDPNPVHRPCPERPRERARSRTCTTTGSSP
jgi:hypothetical protein